MDFCWRTQAVDTEETCTDGTTITTKTVATVYGPHRFDPGCGLFYVCTIYAFSIIRTEFMLNFNNTHRTYAESIRLRVELAPKPMRQVVQIMT